MRGTLCLSIAIVWAAPALADEIAPAPSINLLCMGEGDANRATMVTGFGMNSNGNSAFGSLVGQRSVGFGDQVRIEIPDSGKGRIRMPRAMLPPIRGGKDGWFSIDNIRKTDSEITGSVQVSIVNSPKLRLDRLDGHISISGKSGDYAGSCRPFDPASEQRKF